MTTVTDGTGVPLATRTDTLTHAFLVLLRPDLQVDRVGHILAAVDSLHTDSVQRYGWRVAEALRSDAFAKAWAAVEATCPEPLPVGDVSDSDFGAFEQAQHS